MDLKAKIGFDEETNSAVLQDEFLLEYVNLRLAARGLPHFKAGEYPFMNLTQSLVANYKEKTRLLKDHYCPIDRRIQNFLDDFLSEAKDVEVALPTDFLNLDRHGMSKILSLPPDRDKFESDIVKSYRIQQGILHNPKHDRRTTAGSFHVVDGGLPVPADKKAVPKLTFAKLFEAAMSPPDDLMYLPFTDTQDEKASTWVSIMIRPIVCPEVPGCVPEKSMETRFFVPGNLVSNLDFVESIFGNGGDASLRENDSALDVEHWTGTTGCVILAPHLIYVKKKDMGLPHISEATERQKRDGMCWENEDELYNDGTAFKIIARDQRGVLVTLIADNYFGYCKKDVKMQISYSANLFGQCEEEHAGGTIAYPRYDLGEEFRLSDLLKNREGMDQSLLELAETYPGIMDLQTEGYAIDKNYDNIIYVPKDAGFYLHDQKVIWKHKGKEQKIQLSPDKTYIYPSGYKVEMMHPHEGRRWRLVGTVAEGTFCHKPSTVSGGGKSEISKPISDAIMIGPVVVTNFDEDFKKVKEVINYDYRTRFSDKVNDEGRELLDMKRSLGSVIQLLTPHRSYNDEYNEWISSIPQHIKGLVFTIKRFYKPDWGDDWEKRFHVDYVDGTYGNQVKYRDQNIYTHYVRLGFTDDGSWRTFALRKDFFPAEKLQTEDDITASIVLPADQVEGLNPDYKNPSVKFAKNCEYRLFQRPDDAIIRGYDKATELDMSRKGNFLSNYEPLEEDFAKELKDDTIRFEQYTEPMQNLINSYMNEGKVDYFVSSAHPRLVNGVPTKNPRYLQDRDSLRRKRDYYICDIGTRFLRRIPEDKPVHNPVNSVLPGRRANPPEKGVRALCAFNPMHYLALPELFMEFISSLTGKSPSTTGAGSEGALTKGPFNSLCPIVDLNNALVSQALTSFHSFITTAGVFGPNAQVAHDFSIVIPEVWSRMREEERDPAYMIERGLLEKCEDFEYEGRTIPASILGYRITNLFVTEFFGRILSHPTSIFTEEMLKPELQSMEVFVDGMDNIMEAHKNVAALYFEDGSIEDACPPLKALLHIMANGNYEGKTLQDEEIRKLFHRDNIIKSDWYQERLDKLQKNRTQLWERHLKYIETAIAESSDSEVADLRLNTRRRFAADTLDSVKSKKYRQDLEGTIGLDPAVV